MLGIMQAREIMPSKRACRSLFGPVNHDEVKKTLAREMEELDNRQKKEWNFDFKNGVPLAGKFHWERVTPNDTRVPMAYKVMLGHLEPKQGDSDDVETALLPSESTEAIGTESSPETTLPDIGEPVIPSSPLPTTSQDDLQELTETTPPSQKLEASRKRKRQSEITDFYPVTKVAKNDK